MQSDDFYAAKVIESDGWEFLGTSDAGDMMFSRIIGGIPYFADVSVEH